VQTPPLLEYKKYVGDVLIVICDVVLYDTAAFNEPLERQNICQSIDDMKQPEGG
jgi:hypothetical protein